MKSSPTRADADARLRFFPPHLHDQPVSRPLPNFIEAASDSDLPSNLLAQIGSSVIVWTLLAGEKKARSEGLIQKRKIRWNALHLEVYDFCSAVDVGGMILLAGGCAFM